MIKFDYIREEFPYNKELDSVIGFDYANDGKSVRINPIRVDYDSWIEEHTHVHDCIGNGQCERCSENEDYDLECFTFRTNKGNFTFVRTRSHKLAHSWTNWYDESYAITPIK